MFRDIWVTKFFNPQLRHSNKLPIQTGFARGEPHSKLPHGHPPRFRSQKAPNPRHDEPDKRLKQAAENLDRGQAGQPARENNPKKARRPQRVKGEDRTIRKRAHGGVYPDLPARCKFFFFYFRTTGACT